MTGPDTAPLTGFNPRPFAVVTPADTDTRWPVPTTAVLAWGMTLPDGSAMVVDCRSGGTTLAAVCAGASSAELLFDGTVVWADPASTGTWAARHRPNVSGVPDRPPRPPRRADPGT